MTKPAPTLAITRSPFVGSDGTLTWTALKQLQDWSTQLFNGLDAQGNLIGNLQQAVQLIGKTGTLGTILQNIDQNGLVTGNGVDFAEPYLHKDTDHIADGTGSPLAGGKIAFVALGSPLTGKVLEWDGANWQWVARTQTLTFAANKFVVSYDMATGILIAAQPAFTDISGTATAAQVPPLSGLTGQITAGQLPAGGFTGTAALAKLTALGSNGSITFVDGQATAYSAPT